MARYGSTNPTDTDDAPNGMSGKGELKGPKVLGGRRLFEKKNPGSPGKLGKSSTKAESLAKLRGKGALA